MTEGTRAQGRGVGGMSRRAAAWLAWSMCALSLALTAISLLLLVLNASHPHTPVHPYWTVNTLLAVGFAPVGAVIVPRISTKNPIGWLMLISSLAITLNN